MALRRDGHAPGRRRRLRRRLDHPLHAEQVQHRRPVRLERGRVVVDGCDPVQRPKVGPVPKELDGGVPLYLGQPEQNRSAVRVRRPVRRALVVQEALGLAIGDGRVEGQVAAAIAGGAHERATDGPRRQVRDGIDPWGVPRRERGTGASRRSARLRDLCPAVQRRPGLAGQGRSRQLDGQDERQGQRRPGPPLRHQPQEDQRRNHAQRKRYEIAGVGTGDERQTHEHDQGAAGQGARGAEGCCLPVRAGVQPRLQAVCPQGRERRDQQVSEPVGVA